MSGPPTPSRNERRPSSAAPLAPDPRRVARQRALEASASSAGAVSQVSISSAWVSTGITSGWTARQSFPTCLHIAIRFQHEPEDLTIREANAALAFLRPGEDWEMEPALPEDDGWADFYRSAHDAPAFAAARLLDAVVEVGTAAAAAPG